MASTTRIFKNVNIIWKHFSGQVDQFNQQVGVDSHGKPISARYFSIVLTEEMAEELRSIELKHKSGKVYKGCNIRTTLPKNGEGEPLYTLKVRFTQFPPEEIWRIIPAGKIALDLDTVGVLDHEKIDHANVVVSFYTYENGPNCGITASLVKLAAWVEEDEFNKDDSFANLPVIGGPDSGYSGPVSDEDDLPF